MLIVYKAPHILAKATAIISEYHSYSLMKKKESLKLLTPELVGAHASQAAAHTVSLPTRTTDVSPNDNSKKEKEAKREVKIERHFP